MCAIWADPSVTRNIHCIEVEADDARLTMQIENVPSIENPCTGRLTPLSMIAALKKLPSPLAIGTWYTVSKLPNLWIRQWHRFGNAIDGSPGRG
jgi:hypothetical protein